MKKLILIFLLSLISLPVSAATLCITFTNQTSQCIDVSTGDANRIVNAYQNVLGQVSDGEGGFRNRTPAETFQGLSRGIFDGIKSNVLRYEQDQAANTARDNVLPLEEQ